MMYTVEQIMQAIGTLDKPEKDRLLRALGPAAGASLGQSGRASAALDADERPDYVLTYEGGDEENAGGFAIASDGSADSQMHRLDLSVGQSAHQADYDALIAGLEELYAEVARQQRVAAECTVEVRGPSRLVMQQLLGLWRAGDARLAERRDLASRLLNGFRSYRLVEVPSTQAASSLGR